MWFLKCMDRAFQWYQKVLKKLYFSWRYTTSNVVSLSRTHPVCPPLANWLLANSHSVKWLSAKWRRPDPFQGGIKSPFDFLPQKSIHTFQDILWAGDFESPNFFFSRSFQLRCFLAKLEQAWARKPGLCFRLAVDKSTTWSQRIFSRACKLFSPRRPTF